MENYRKDLGELVVCCDFEDCRKLYHVHRSIETSLKEGQAFKCTACGRETVFTREFIDYLKQTRCYS